MDDNEGSVFTEDSDEEAEESQEETEESTEEEESTDDKTSEESTDKTEEEADGSLKDQEQKQEKTEKGTKLDENPISRVNQELANERAKVKRYEEVLNDPDTLKKYVKTFDKPATEEEGEKEPEIRYEDVQTTEDLQKFLKQQDSKVQSKLKELDETITNVKTSQKDSGVATKIQSDITAARESYPELNPKSDVYSKELDQAVGELYEKNDYDPTTKSFKGQASIKDIADIVMRAAGHSKKKGSEEAQTTVKDKRSGRAVSGASNAAVDETNLTPGQIIANRIKRAREGR